MSNKLKETLKQIPFGMGAFPPPDGECQEDCSAQNEPDKHKKKNKLKSDLIKG